MHFDLAEIPATDAYKLLVSTVVPRPIALVTTIDGEGRVNAAPFSLSANHRFYGAAGRDSTWLPFKSWRLAAAIDVREI